MGNLNKRSLDKLFLHVPREFSVKGIHTDADEANYQFNRAGVVVIQISDPKQEAIHWKVHFTKEQ